MNAENKMYVELVGDKTEVTLRLTVGQLVALSGILSAKTSHAVAELNAVAAGIAKPGADADSLLDYMNALVAVNDALAKSQGFTAMYGGARAMIDQAEAQVRDGRAA